MDYSTAASKLTGRCKDSRKLENNTYLKRLNDITIAVKLHRTNVVTFHANGAIDLNDGGWCTITTQDRINRYFEGYVSRQDGYWFTSYKDQRVGGLGSVTAKGQLVGSCSATELERKIRTARSEAQRPRNRARYWINKARGFSIDRSACTYKRWAVSVAPSEMRLGLHHD